MFQCQEGRRKSEYNKDKLIKDKRLLPKQSI